MILKQVFILLFERIVRVEFHVRLGFKNGQGCG